MIKLYHTILRKASKQNFPHKIINSIVLMLLLCSPYGMNAQCDCTNCPDTVAPNTTMDFDFEVIGAANDDLSNGTQGVCAVLLDISPEHFWSTQFVLRSPAGQQVTLIGPPRLDLLIGYSAVGPWNIAFVPCADDAEPDPLFPEAWDNDFFDFGIVGGSYTGTYHPYNSCLEDFNTGTVNGTWTLSVQNVSGFYNVEVDFFQIVFCDESGLDCNPCQADAGVIASNVVIDACPNDTILNLDLPPSYTNTPPDTSLYGYTYIVSYNGIIEEYNPTPNLMGWDPGTYLICGLSYSYEDSLKIPQADGSLTRVDVEAALQNLNPIFCGDITDDCVIVNILPPDTLSVDAFLCAGDSYDFRGETYDTAGVYIFNSSMPNACDSTIILNLTGLDSIRTTIDTTICNGEIFGVGSKSYNTTGNYIDTLNSYQNCDSIVYLNLQVRDSIVSHINKAICVGDSCVIGNNVYNSNGVFVNTFVAYNGCDSLVILDLKILEPDAFIMQAPLLTCLTSPITLDGSGSSTGSSIVYTWTHLNNGGDGIVSGADTATPQVDKIGDYELMVTDTLRGAACSASATVSVFGDLDTPHVLATTDSITCSNPTATLFGLSLTTGVSFEWTGPNGFYASQKDTVTDMAGFYTFIVTASNGCQDSVVLEVKENLTKPMAQILGDTLNCTNTQVLLDGASSIGTQLNFEWRNGLGAYLDNTNSILVSNTDTYSLIVQNGNNGCRDTSSFEVVEDLSTPDIQAQAGALTCTDTVTNLSGTSATGISFQWTGPASFVAYSKDTMSNLAGMYTLVVTGENGCTNEETVEIDLDQTAPTGTTDSELITCANPVAALTANSTDGIAFRWTGPSSFEAFSKDTFTNEAGLYQLTITGANGCTTIIDEMVLVDLAEPDVVVDADTINCLNLTAGLYGTSSTPNVDYNWIGVAGFSSSMADTITDTPGAYQLTVTAVNGCTSSAQILVIADQNAPDVTASADTITCAILEASLMGTSTNTTVNYAWTGPAGFTASQADTSSSVAGNYQLLVTADNGCTNSATVEIILDQIIPDIDASVGSISCSNAEANLTGSSTTAGVSYLWSGPSAYLSTTPDTITNIPGTYQFVVTASNACTAQMELEVLADQDIPDIMATADTITCLNTIANLNSSSSILGLDYEWQGPAGFSATSADTITDTPGLYQLTVNAANGCSASTQVEVIANIDLPDISVDADTLNCGLEEAALSGNSSIAGVSYSWTGPSGFSSSQADTVTSIPGVYQLTITAPNACVSTEQIIVVLDDAIPNIAATADSITCATSMASLLGNSTTLGVSYQWTGPAGFNAGIADTSTTVPGIYQLEVTAPNACTATAEVEVLVNQDIPSISTTVGVIDCINENANLQVESNETNLSYQWTGPAGFSTTQADTSTSISGLYQVVALAPNGCTTSEEVEVVIDTIVPVVSVSADTLDCATTEAQLESESLDGNLSYQWTGPMGFSATVEDTTTSFAGLYQLTVTAANGCSSTMSIELIEDTEAPEVFASADTINCSNNIANLIGTSSDPDVTYQWIGPNGFNSQSSDTTTNTPGVYQLIVTGTNACTASAQVLVIEDQNIPNISASADSISCASGMASLQGSSTTLSVSYQWTGPGGFNANIADTSTTVAGVYQLQVTASNGCTATTDVDVFLDQNVPDVTVEATNIDCENEIANLQVNTNELNLSYQWTGPAGFSSTQEDTTSSLSGIYQVVVTADNGCSIAVEVEVLSDTLSPVVVLSTDTLSCDLEEAQLEATSLDENLSYQWTGPMGFTATVEDTSTNFAGTYQLVATGSNGCSTSTQIEVLEDIAIPNISASADTITCNNSIANLTGTSTNPNLSYEWIGPAGFTSQMADTTTNIAGVYELTVTANNGCTATAEVLVVADQDVPDIVGEAGEITCVSDVATLQGSSSVAGVNYTWTGPAGFFSQQQDTSTTIIGTYTLSISTPNGCTASTDVIVVENQNNPDISATTDTISCTDPTANLLGNSLTENVSYEWNGPGGFNASQKDTTTTVTGIYELVVTASNGCTSNTFVIVVADQDLPDVSAEADTINCLSDTANLLGNSLTGNVSYQWTGPAGFNASQKDTSTTIAGVYQLIVTASNNCTAVTQVEVILDISNPDVAVEVDTINCNDEVASLSANASDGTLQYEWTGPMGFFSNLKDTSTTITGIYNLKATGLNGCVVNIPVEVIADVAIPDVTVSADSLSCENTEPSLSASSTSLGVSYEWTGPNGFFANVADTFTTIAGTYQLVISAENGCSQTVGVVVVDDQDLPDVSATADSISCTNTIANLSASSTNALTYIWTGPNGFTSTSADTSTTIAGVYEIVITATNGCTNSMEVEVTADQNIPQITALADTINCLNLIASLTSSSTNSNVTYAWTGPNGFQATVADTSTTIAGLYELVVTAANACSATTQVEVIDDQELPELSALADTINCLQTEAQLLGSTTVDNPIYEWTGPNGFMANSKDTVTDLAGTYTLQVTGENGCSNSSSVEVIQDNTSPVISAADISTLNCINAIADLTASSTTVGVSYTWSGPNGFFANVSDTTSNIPGFYELTLTGENGCTSSTTLELVEDITIPDISASSDTINCNQSQVNLDGGSTTVGVSYTWTGPNGFTAFSADTISELAGTYQLIVRAMNGCTASASLEVLEDTTPPDVFATADTINCINLSANLIGNSTSPNASYLWTGPNNFIAFQKDTTSEIPGAYQLIATAMNGCRDTVALDLIADQEAPDLEVEADSITCSQQFANLSASSTISNLDYQWTGPNGFLVNDWNAQANIAGLYQFSATAANGCSAEEELQVIADTLSPIAVANVSGNLNCTQNLAILNGVVASSGTSWLYEWQDEQGTFLTEDSVVEATENGLYQFIVTDVGNDCKDTAYVDLVLDDLEVEEAPVANNDTYDMLNLNSITIDLSENDLLDQVNDWELQILNPPNVGSLATLSPGVFEYNVFDYTGDLSFDYELCNTLCPDLCDTATVTIQVEFQILTDTSLNIPTGFTPNDDGKNDVFIIPELELYPDRYPENELIIFNRWGNVVFQASPYQNDWDGRSQSGKALPHGTYYYILRLDFSTGKIFQGDVTILR